MIQKGRKGKASGHLVAGLEERSLLGLSEGGSFIVDTVSPSLVFGRPRSSLSLSRTFLSFLASSER